MPYPEIQLPQNRITRINISHLLCNCTEDEKLGQNFRRNELAFKIIRDGPILTLMGERGRAGAKRACRGLQARSKFLRASWVPLKTLRANPKIENREN